MNLCKIIPDEIDITIHLLSDITISERIDLHHPQGRNIIIDGNGFSIIIEIEVSSFVQFSCGKWLHTMGIKSDGTLWGTGANSEGNLGTGDNDSVEYFTQESHGNIDWKKVDSGEYHTLALKNDGTIWGTGYNGYGELGLGGPRAILCSP